MFKLEELDKIIKLHQHWLKKDCKGWEDMRANLCGSDLSDLDLRRVLRSYDTLVGEKVRA